MKFNEFFLLREDQDIRQSLRNVLANSLHEPLQTLGNGLQSIYNQATSQQSDLQIVDGIRRIQDEARNFFQAASPYLVRDPRAGQISGRVQQVAPQPNDPNYEQYHNVYTQFQTRAWEIFNQMFPSQ